jgi:hypothetical protein
MGSDLLHADDTPIRVLDRSRREKGLGKGVKQGRIWAYVRDQRPWAGGAPPGAVYRFAPDWKEEHVLSHLANARGILQADGYKGYAKLYEPGADGVLRLREAACWAHLRRDFHDFWASTKSEIAREALDRIGKLYDIERDINGQPADVRQATRQKLSEPKVAAGKKAVSAAMREAGTSLKSAWRGQITGAGLGTRLGNSIRLASFPKSGDSLNAAALVWSNAPVIIGAHDTGPLIRSKNGFWLSSRLIDLHSQNKTVAASATEERKTFGHLL